MTFDLRTYQKLKTEYKVATKQKVEVFNFEGHEILTNYAKYLLEYLQPKFEN